MSKLTPTVLSLLQSLKDNGLEREAELIYRIHKQLLHGQVTIVIRGGMIERIERERIFDNLSEDLLKNG